MDHPSLANQLFGNEGDGASLKSGHAGKIGPRNRLAAPDKVKNDSAIDVAGRLARGHLRISKVNALHLVAITNYI
jgi:hypothetical protein